MEATPLRISESHNRESAEHIHGHIEIDNDLYAARGGLAAELLDEETVIAAFASYRQSDISFQRKLPNKNIFNCDAIRISNGFIHENGIDYLTSLDSNRYMALNEGLMPLPIMLSYLRLVQERNTFLWQLQHKPGRLCLIYQPSVLRELINAVSKLQDWKGKDYFQVKNQDDMNRVAALDDPTLTRPKGSTESDIEDLLCNRIRSMFTNGALSIFNCFSLSFLIDTAKDHYFCATINMNRKHIIIKDPIPRYTTDTIHKQALYALQLFLSIHYFLEGKGVYVPFVERLDVNMNVTEQQKSNFKPQCGPFACALIEAVTDSVPYIELPGFSSFGVPFRERMAYALSVGKLSLPYSPPSSRVKNYEQK